MRNYWKSIVAGNRKLETLLLVFSVVLFASLPAWAFISNTTTIDPNLSHFSTVPPPQPATNESVIKITGRVVDRMASGLLSGSARFTSSEAVRITSGGISVKNWGYNVLTYQLPYPNVTYTGSLYLVIHDDEIWGMVTGDIEAVAISHNGGETVTWYVSRINNVETCGTISLGNAAIITSGNTTTYDGTPGNQPKLAVELQTGITQTSTVTGPHYSGTINTSIEAIKIPSLSKGVAIVNYTNVAEGTTGTRYLFMDNSSNTFLRKGVSVGPIFGTYDVWFLGPPQQGTQFGGKITHVTSCLPRTGQTGIYAAEDDGAFQAGVPWPNPRFEIINRTGNGVGSVNCSPATNDCDGITGNDLVADNLTGLVWPRDANSPTFGTTCSGGQKNWLDSLLYVDCLNSQSFLGHSDWRLPNISELGFVNASQLNMAGWLPAQGFSNVQPWYWSSTSSANSLSTFGWNMDMNTGIVDYDDKSLSVGYYAWPVRDGLTVARTRQTQSNGLNPGEDGNSKKGVEWPGPRFSTNADQTITDNLTGLVWADNANTPAPSNGTCAGSGQPMHWPGGSGSAPLPLAYVKCVNTQGGYRGHTDWRLPNIIELQSLVDHANQNPALPSGMPSIVANTVNPTHYWSSTNHGGVAGDVRSVDFWGGGIYFADRNPGSYVWMVREGTLIPNPTVATQFSFTSQNCVPINQWATSNTITVGGITGAASISVVNGEYKINSGVFVSTPGWVSSGDTVSVRQTSSSSAGTTTTATLTIGSVSGTFSVTTFSPTTCASTPTISGNPPTSATVGTPYSFTPTATNAVGFSTTSTLPPGLTFSNTTGSLTGTPTTAGSYSNIVITATNPNGTVSLLPFTIIVAAVTAVTPPAPGSPVTVTPTPGVTMTFNSVTSGGNVTVTPLSNPSPPANFRVLSGSSYQITTTAAFNGQITVCFNYSDAALANSQNEANIRLFHHNGQNWVDITTSIDMVNNRVYGVTTSLSPFILAEPITLPPVVVASKVPVMNGWWLVPAMLSGVVLFRRRKYFGE